MQHIITRETIWLDTISLLCVTINGVTLLFILLCIQFCYQNISNKTNIPRKYKILNLFATITLIASISVAVSILISGTESTQKKIQNQLT